jgi:hypothetical protein
MSSKVPEKHVQFILWALASCGLILLGSLFLGSSAVHILRIILFWVFILLSVIVILRLFTESDEASKKQVADALNSQPVSEPLPLNALIRGLSLGYEILRQLSPIALLRRFSRAHSANQQSLRAARSQPRIGSTHEAIAVDEDTVFNPIHKRVANKEQTQIGQTPKALPSAPLTEELTGFRSAQKQLPAKGKSQIKPTSQTPPLEELTEFRSVRSCLPDEDRSQNGRDHNASPPKDLTTSRPIHKSLSEEERSPHVQYSPEPQVQYSPEPQVQYSPEPLPLPELAPLIATSDDEQSPIQPSYQPPGSEQPTVSIVAPEDVRYEEQLPVEQRHETAPKDPISPIVTQEVLLDPQRSQVEQTRKAHSASEPTVPIAIDQNIPDKSRSQPSHTHKPPSSVEVTPPVVQKVALDQQRSQTQRLDRRSSIPEEQTTFKPMQKPPVNKDQTQIGRTEIKPMQQPRLEEDKTQIGQVPKAPPPDEPTTFRTIPKRVPKDDQTQINYPKKTPPKDEQTTIGNNPNRDRA